MILTKAYITKTPSQGDNKYQVRVPLMEDNTGGEALFEALLCTDPSIYNQYKEGDCVYVHFEDNKQNIPVIMGSLFTEIPNSNESYILANELKVTDKAYLPPSTRLGDYTAQDLTNLYNAVLNIDGGFDEDILKKYVRWINTEREVENPETHEIEYVDYYADKIQTVNKEEYEKIIENSEGELDEEDLDTTLYFVSQSTQYDPAEKYHINFAVMTESEYESLSVKRADTIYFIYKD